MVRFNASTFAATKLTASSQADKLRTQQELERLQAKYIGTGHPDTTSWEWRTNIQRDTYSSIVGHRPLLSYVALAENEPSAKTRAKMIKVCATYMPACAIRIVTDEILQKMVQPNGPPPPRED